MKREDAIALYGRHYTLSVHSRTIYEILGTPHAGDDDEAPITDPTRAHAEMKDRLSDAAMKRIARIDETLRKPLNRFQIFLARHGMLGRSDAINAAAARLRAEKESLEQDVRKDFSDSITINALPDDIKMPVALAPGRALYIVRANFLEEGIKLTTAQITQRRVWSGSFGRGDWDYVFSYTATDDKGKSLSFEYNRADESNPVIDNNYHGIHYFLTPDAADEFILSTATRARDHFSAAANDARARIDARRPAPKNPAPGPS